MVGRDSLNGTLPSLDFICPGPVPVSGCAWDKKSRRGRTPRGVLNRVGLLVNGPVGTAGLPFI